MTDAHPLNVLLVEDNPTDVLLVKDALADVTGIEFYIAVANRLQQALQQLADEKFDVVILDLGLPDSNGIATFEQLQMESPEMPVLVLTALSDESLATLAVQRGAQDFLIKSQLQHSLLGRFIRFAIERHHLQRTLQGIHEKEQREHELQSMERLVQVGGTSITAGIYSGAPLSYTLPREFGNLVSRYSEVLDITLEEAIYGEDNGRSEALRQLAVELGFLCASPRDAIDIHTAALKAKTINVPWKKAQAYREEGRLTVLELMGNLTGYYRSLTSGLTHQESAHE